MMPAAPLPAWRLDPALHAWRTDPRCVAAAYGLLPATFAPRTMLDPGAGNGVWGQQALARWPQLAVTGVELQGCAPAAGYAVWQQADLRQWVAPQRYDFIAGNPPFGDLGFPIIRRCLTEWLAPGGYALFYYHSRILASLDRATYYAQHAPIAVRHLVPRPSHTDKPTTENQGEYVVLLWHHDEHGEGGSGTYRGGWLHWREPEGVRAAVQQTLAW